MKNNLAFRMLVQLDLRHTASRAMTSGVLRFAAAHRDLEVQFTSCEPNDYYRAWKPNALITDASSQTCTRETLADLAGRAIVYVNTTPRADLRRPYATITTDERQLALTATDLLLGKNLNTFAFVGTPEKAKWSEARRRLFQAALKDRGKRLLTFTAPAAADWRTQERALADWLLNLPKPCGIWAACDARAKQVLDTCRLAKIDVPDQVQVLGVDDDNYICELTLPSLSSIAPDFEAGGFAAAEFLYGILTGSKVATRTVLKFSIKGAVERLSTADVNGTARRVTAAREYIRKHATAGISIPDVAASLGVSTRLLEKNYRAVTGRTVLADIQAMRLEKVKDMLRKTTMPIDNIGPFCGFNSPSHLKTLFRSTFGMTMSDYRRS